MRWLRMPPRNYRSPQNVRDGIPSDEGCDGLVISSDEGCDGLVISSDEGCAGLVISSDECGDGLVISSDEGCAGLVIPSDEGCAGLVIPSDEGCDGLVIPSDEGCDGLVIPSDEGCAGLVISSDEGSYEQPGATPKQIGRGSHHSERGYSQYGGGSAAAQPQPARQFYQRRGETTRLASLRGVSAMGTPLVLLSHPVGNDGCGDQRRIKN
jgi:hypothetical protein